MGKIYKYQLSFQMIKSYPVQKFRCGPVGDQIWKNLAPVRQPSQGQTRNETPNPIRVKQESPIWLRLGPFQFLIYKNIIKILFPN